MNDRNDYQDREPIDAGRVVARISRPVREGPDGERGNPEELWIAIREYNGAEFIDCRMWFCGREQRWLPTKKGITVRKGELRQVADLFTKLAEKLAPAARPPAGGGQRQAVVPPAGPPVEAGWGLEPTGPDDPTLAPF